MCQNQNNHSHAARLKLKVKLRHADARRFIYFEVYVFGASRDATLNQAVSLGYRSSTHMRRGTVGVAARTSRPPFWRNSAMACSWSVIMSSQARSTAAMVRGRLLMLICLKPQIGHNIGFQAPLSSQSAWITRRPWHTDSITHCKYAVDLS